MTVPAFDLARAVRRIAPALDERWRQVLASNVFIGGPEVRDFERAFAAYVGAPGCVAVANGTDALVVALRALDVGPGDEVVIPGFSFFATAEAVYLVGARPVFADVEEATLNLDPDDAARRVGPRTVGVIGVHLYGRPFDADRLRALCERHGLWLMEDAAQAHGAAWRGRRAGTLGALATWSFYPSKNLGCFGDGGGVTGDSAALLERVRRIANHGGLQRYQHLEIGTNSRLDALQAAVLNLRLAGLEADNTRRRELACRYYGGLAGIGDLKLPQDPPEATSVYHQLTVRTRRRAALAEHLERRGVGFSVHYPEPLHRLPAVEAVAGRLDPLPVAEAAAAEVLSLPMFAELTDAEVDEVCGAVRDFYANAGG